MPAAVFPSISELIPHQPPMQLLDEVLECSESAIKTRVDLKNGAPFWTPRGVPSCIGLEYLGQSAAAFFSVLAIAAADNSADQKADQETDQGTAALPPRPGMLIASRSYRCATGFFPAEGVLLITVSPTTPLNADGLVKFTGTISDLSSTECFAKGDLSVYLPPA